MGSETGGLTWEANQGSPTQRLDPRRDWKDAGCDRSCIVDGKSRATAPPGDLAAVGQLLGTKTVMNEFVAYGDMNAMIAEGALSPRSVTIATYALCGFANPGSLGILIAGLSGLVPERRKEITQLGLKSLVAGTLAVFMTACIAGILG